MKATVDFSTMLYMNSHGKQPRGHGAWAFEVGGGDAGVFQLDEMTLALARAGNAQPRALRTSCMEMGPKLQLWVYGASFAEAKKVVREALRMRCLSAYILVEVAP